MLSSETVLVACAVVAYVGHWVYKRSRHPSTLKYLHNCLRLAGEGASSHHQRYRGMAQALADAQEALEFGGAMSPEKRRTTKEGLLEITRDEVLARVGMAGPSDREACTAAVMRLYVRFGRAYPKT